MKSITKITICALFVVLVLGTAYAQFAKSEEAVKYRKAVMTLIVQHFKRMGAVVQGKAAYDKESFAADAAAVEMLATLPWDAMRVPGTDKGDTTLSPAVFDKPAQFTKAASSFETATKMLADTAKGGDLNTIKPQFGKVAQNCGSCHKQFRKK